MMIASTFLLDANVFIEAARSYYSFTIAPGFWENLINHATDGRLLSIDRIKRELEKGKDELKTWADNRFSNYFSSTDDENVITAYSEIMNWVQDNDEFFDHAKTEFAAGADGWLIAYAKANGCIIVTHETLKPQKRNKVPIPNVCENFNVSYIDTFEMLKRLRVRLR